MSGPSNVVMGDLDEPTSVPHTEVPEEAIIEEQKMAKYSQTAEFKRLKDYMESRIVFFQRYLPDGTAVSAYNKDLEAHWRAANIVIGEFQSVLREYETASAVVKEAEQLG